MRARLFNIVNLNNNYLSFMIPYSEKMAFGIDWFNVGFDDDELKYFRHKFNFAMGTRLFYGLSLGINVKYLNNYKKNLSRKVKSRLSKIPF